MPLSDIPFLTSLKALHGFAANCVCIPGGGGGGGGLPTSFKSGWYPYF